MTTTLNLLSGAVGNVNGPAFTYNFSNALNGTITITVTGTFASLQILTSTSLVPNEWADPPLTLNASGTYTFSAVNVVSIRAFVVAASADAPVGCTASF